MKRGKRIDKEGGSLDRDLRGPLPRIHRRNYCNRAIDGQKEVVRKERSQLKKWTVK